MQQQERDEVSSEHSEPQGQDVTAGKGRRDEVGHTGIYPGSGPYPAGETDVLTPGEINSPHERTPEGVQQSDALKGSERLPRKGDEE